MSAKKGYAGDNTFTSFPFIQQYLLAYKSLTNTQTIVIPMWKESWNDV